MSLFVALVRKEASEMVREKRLPIFALIYTVLAGLITFFLLDDAARSADLTTATTPLSALGIALPLFFLNILGLVIVAATFIFDAVGRERDAGMLGLVLTTPASPALLLLSKLVVAVIGYAVIMTLGLVMSWIVGFSLGSVVPQAMLLGFIGPLLVLYVFLVGSGLLLSVVAPSARLAIALGIGLDLPLFLAGATPIFSALFAAAPIVGRFIDYTPFAAANKGITSIMAGGPTPWSEYAVTIAVALACLATAFVVFDRQEVARS